MIIGQERRTALDEFIETLRFFGLRRSGAKLGDDRGDSGGIGGGAAAPEEGARGFISTASPLSSIARRIEELSRGRRPCCQA